MEEWPEMKSGPQKNLRWRALQDIVAKASIGGPGYATGGFLRQLWNLADLTILEIDS